MGGANQDLRLVDGIVATMLEAVYLVILIGAFVVIGAMSMFILFKLFAGQE